MIRVSSESLGECVGPNSVLVCEERDQGKLPGEGDR